MEKMDYEHGTFNIITTRTDGFDYADYEEYCEENDIEPTENGFNEWVSEETMCNFEADMDNIKYCKDYNTEVEITGELGLWDGKHEIEPVTCDNVEEALKKCFGSCDDVEADWSDGVINVRGYHHDGTNCFTIKKTNGERLSYLYA